MLIMTIKVLPGQSFYDLSIQYTGSIDNAFNIALANQRSVTDKLQANDLIIIPDSLPTSKKVLQYYQARTILPATGIKKENNVFAYELAIQF
jgi:hypothetical protein